MFLAVFFYWRECVEKNAQIIHLVPNLVKGRLGPNAVHKSTSNLVRSTQILEYNPKEFRKLEYTMHRRYLRVLFRNIGLYRAS